MLLNPHIYGEVIVDKGEWQECTKGKLDIYTQKIKLDLYFIPHTKINPK